MEKERLEGAEDIHKVDRVARFTGVHPAVMADRIAAFDFAFEHTAPGPAGSSKTSLSSR